MNTPTLPPKLQAPRLPASPSRAAAAGLLSEAGVSPGGRLVEGAPRRSIRPVKSKGADLRAQHRIVQELSLVVALLLVIGLVRAPLQWEASLDMIVAEQEVVQMEEVQVTKQEVAPPPPPNTPQPIVVSDETVIDDVPLNLDASLDLDEVILDLPPPPPPVAEVEEKRQARAEEEEIFVVVEQMPEMLPNQAEAMRALQASIVYPQLARQAGVEGRVFVEFIVDKQGNVVNPRVLRGIGAGCDEEAVRAVQTLKFKPGMQRGRAVRVRYAIPITFRLRDTRR